VYRARDRAGWTTSSPGVDEEALFRRRLRQIVLEKYGSLYRFYLETDFSKGHLSQILRRKRSPSVAILCKLAKVLDVQVADLFRS
jgi:transcriptional regulator with XRE-family HTH domain